MATADVPWTLARETYSLERVSTLKGDTGVAVIVSAKDEAATVGGVLDSVQIHDHLIDELIVVNDHSSDDTATVAEHHGARVVHVHGAGGKGAAMSAGFLASDAELIVFLDADVTNTTPDYVARLIQPLLECPATQLVKGFYERPLHHMPTGGGRVNELAARPILSLLFPGLGEIRQPLAGETALRRGVLETIDLEPDYRVEIALLIDCARLFGVRALAQVDLGIRRHRNRPLEELRPMAVDVLRAALERYKVDLPSTQ
ncbi:MAG TPA: glycosyltransferase [Acidimicrobiales bacterium]|nr:glycosyltransferase [Acidimicrobiales bacterium]